MSLPALRYEPEAYQLSDNRIMGRQSAGEAFLKAIARGSSGQVLSGFGPLASSAKAFSESIFVCSPQTKTDWIFPSRLDKLSQLGGVHFPDPVILDAAKARLRLGPAAYSITGVTHTIASQAVMKFIAEIPTSPLMPWDGLICTSKSVKDAVHKIIEAQEEYLSWRLNVSIKIAYPEFPIIPLGVHAEDFQHPLTVRNQARHSLGIQDDEVVFLFLGRLSFHAKANPFPMYEALEAAAKKTDKRITLIQCGWFANKFIEDAFKSGGQKYAPSVKQLWLDGLIERDRLSAWSSGDIFISLPDNIQETFGLAPLEAMAAGMPVIVSDWDGYRETVPHGIVGFRVPTSAPKAPLGEVYAHQYATGLSDYDNYIGLAAQHVSLDIRALTEAAVSLAESASLRRGLGEAGRRLVSDKYDWKIVIKEYIAFWDHLSEIRKAEHADVNLQPIISADRQDPFELFGHYPTFNINFNTEVRETQSPRSWRELISDPLFRVGRNYLPADDVFEIVQDSLSKDEWISVGDVAVKGSISLSSAISVLSVLSKMGIVEFFPKSELNF